MGSSVPPPSLSPPVSLSRAWGHLLLPICHPQWLQSSPVKQVPGTWAAKEQLNCLEQLVCTEIHGCGNTEQRRTERANVTRHPWCRILCHFGPTKPKATLTVFSSTGTQDTNKRRPPLCCQENTLRHPTAAPPPKGRSGPSSTAAQCHRATRPRAPGSQVVLESPREGMLSRAAPRSWLRETAFPRSSHCMETHETQDDTRDTA